MDKSWDSCSCHCPLCDGEAVWVGKDAPEEQRGFHHWCKNCQHGWLTADLKNYVGMCLTGKQEEARAIILNADGENKEGK